MKKKKVFCSGGSFLKKTSRMHEEGFQTWSVLMGAAQPFLMFRLEFHNLEIRTKQGNERYLPSKQGLAINSTRSVSSCFVREQLRRPHKVTEESSSASSRHLSLLKIRKQIIVISGKRHAF